MAKLSSLLETASKFSEHQLEHQPTVQHRSSRPVLLSNTTLTSSPRLTIGVSAQGWLCIFATTLTLCISFAQYALIWSGPSCPAFDLFIASSLCFEDGNPVSRHAVSYTAATTESYNKSATESNTETDVQNPLLWFSLPPEPRMWLSVLSMHGVFHWRPTRGTQQHNTCHGSPQNFALLFLGRKLKALFSLYSGNFQCS